MSGTGLRRVGHQGADLIAPGNTLPSFDAALMAGVDMIEFDVLPDGDRLVLAHNYEDARRRSPHTLEDALAHLAGDRLWSVPRLRRDPFRSPVTATPAFLALLILRALLPPWAWLALRRRHCDALMVHWRLVTPRLIRRAAAAGGELYVWTVDELARLHALEQLGVTGVITNDPRLFGAQG